MDNFELIKSQKIFNIGEAFFYNMKCNDLKVILLKNKTAPVLTLNIWFKVGSKNEKDGKTGLAHLFEHMMFRGTKKYPIGVFDKLLDDCGSEGTNAFTSFDYTGYTESIPFNSIELPLILEADRMVHLNLTKEVLDIEREAVLNERELRVENESNGKMFEMLLNNLFISHSYKHDIIGYRKDIENLSVKDCNNFYKKYYSPNNATIVMVGDFECDNALNLIYKQFSKIEKVDIPKQVFKFDESEKKQNNEVIEEFDTETTKILLGYKTVSIKDKDFLPLKLLSIILSGTRSSVFRKEFLYTNKVMQISAEMLTMEHPGIFLIDVVLKPNKNYKDIIHEIDETLKKLHQTVNNEILQIAKSYFNSSTKSLFISNESIASSFGESIILTTDPFYEYNSLDLIHNITSESIKEVISEYLLNNNRTTVILTPKKEVI